MPEGNEPERFAIRFRTDRGATTDVAPPAAQEDPIPIPQAFERLGAPVRLTEQGRAYLITLPLAGTSQVAHEIAVAIDAGVPIRSVKLDVDLDREEGWDELAASLHVDQSYPDALQAWEEIESRLHRARSRLEAEDRAIMEEGFALYLFWEPHEDPDS